MSTQSLRPVGRTLQDMFETFTGKTSIKMMDTLKGMTDYLKDLTGDIEENNELVEQNTNQVVEAIKGLSANTARENVNLQGGVDQLIASFNRMGVLSENQLYFLEEIQNSNLEEVTQNKSAYEDLLVAVDFLRQESANASDEVIANLKSLDEALHDERILRTLRDIGSGLEDDRLRDSMNESRGGNSSIDELEDDNKSNGLFDSIFNFLGMGGSIKGLISKGVGIVKRIGPWMIAISAIWDFVDGFINAGEIVGKAADSLTFFDRVLAGISEIIAGFTFGLLSTKKVFSFLTETVPEAFNTMVGWFQDGVDAIAEPIISFMNSYSNIFGNDLINIVTNYFDILRNFPTSVVNFVKGIADLVEELVSIRSFDDFIGFIGKIKDSFAQLFSPDSMLYKVIQMVNDVLNFATGGLSGLLSDKILDAGSGIAGMASKGFSALKETFFGDDSDQKVSTKIQHTNAMRTDMAPTSQAIDISKKRFEESLAQNEKDKTQPIIVHTPAPIIPQAQPTQRRRLDNMGLSLGNNGAFD